MPLHFSLKSLVRPLMFVLLVLIFAGCTVLPEGTSRDAQQEQTPQLPQPKTLTDPTEIELLNSIQSARKAAKTCWRSSSSA